MNAGIQRKMLLVDLGGQDGTIGIPYFVLRGRYPGPTVFVAAGEHGIELNGVAGALAFVREFERERYRGTLIVVPVVNPPNVAYRHHTKGQPRGEGYTFEMPYNTYMKWPGRADGDPAERICHAIATQLLPGVSTVINFHAWSWTSATAAVAGGNQRVVDEVPMGKRLGVPFFLYETNSSVYQPGRASLAAYASHALGIPGYLVELRMQWTIYPPSVQCGLRVIRNVCRYCGMLRGRFEPNPGGQFDLRDHIEAAVRAPRPGLYLPVRPIETPVRKGEVLGHFYDVTSGRATAIKSPRHGFLWLNHRIGRLSDVRLEDRQAYADKGDLLVLVKSDGPLPRPALHARALA
ncbi:MAG: succinylglutamate desuccinylase/aspartoacylase family protein [Kiritimatiellae bacterium]|nr:succinylglutamate desuccinylase/aspartoacylase family protein [Kiritimatiellia bacterium]